MTPSRYANIQDDIVRTAKQSGRDPGDVRLVAVTKTVPWESVQPIYAAGHRDFGENRVSDALAKKAEAPADCRWHLIGTLQSNKVRKAVGAFVLIHSVDSPELASKISSVSVEERVITPVLLQANVSGEGTKHGLTGDEWKRQFHKVAFLPGIDLRGLMTMAPDTSDETLIRKCFRALRLLRDELRTESGGKLLLKELSMGMSNDYRIAIEEGATLVRIGSALFNPNLTR